MEKANPLALVTFIICYCVRQSHTDCYAGSNEDVDGIIGDNITLSCRKPFHCDNVYWGINNVAIMSLVANLNTDRFVEYSSNNKSFLHLSGITLNDTGSYRCWCYKNDVLVSTSSFCSITITTICQATVIYNGETILYNSSLSNSYVVNVAEGNRIKISCPEGAEPKTNCSNVVQKESSEFTYSFRVRRKHDSCRIVCQVRRNEEVFCSVNFTLNVSTIETSEKPLNVSTTVPTTVSTTSAQPVITNTSSTISAGTDERTDTTIKSVEKKKQDPSVKDTPVSFPAKILVGILVGILILIGVLLVAYFYIVSARSRSRSQHDKQRRPFNPATDNTIPLDESLSISPERYPEGTEECSEQSTSGFYHRINDNIIAAASNQQVVYDNSISYDFYSGIKAANDKDALMVGEAPNRNDLYFEINNENQVNSADESIYLEPKQ